MSNIPGFPFPYFEVQFNKQGDAADENEVNQALNSISMAHSPICSLFPTAGTMIWPMPASFTRTCSTVSTKYWTREMCSNLGSRKFAVLGILWPSKKFAEEDLIPSGAAGINSAVTVEFIQKQLDNLKGCL